MPSANARSTKKHKRWIKHIHILAAPRSGGNFVRAWLLSTGRPVQYRHQDEWHREDCSQSMLIMLYRRDIFQQCISRCVLAMTGHGQGQEYLDDQGRLWPSLQQFQIPIPLFAQQIWHTVSFHSDTLDIAVRYAEHHKIYYEDWVADADRGMQRLGLKRHTKTVRLPVPTPVSAENIKNYHELAYFFAQVMHTMRNNLPYLPLDADAAVMLEQYCAEHPLLHRQQTPPRDLFDIRFLTRRS